LLVGSHDITCDTNVAGERGAADAERDVRGFALRFYTEEGNWDIVGNNTPVFFVRDPWKFPDFIHTQKRHPRTNLRSSTAMWDFWSLLTQHCEFCWRQEPQSDRRDSKAALSLQDASLSVHHVP
jgi:hypothetical protein